MKIRRILKIIRISPRGLYITLTRQSVDLALEDELVLNRVKKDTNEEMFKKILLELNILKDCNHKRVVAFYGSYQYQRSQIRICMEYMDGGSLDKVRFDRKV